MPDLVLAVGLILLGFAILYAEIRLARYRTERREAIVAAEEQAIEAMRGGS